MAQLGNTYESYDMKGIKEDLTDVIYNISPEETPFYTACKKTKASNTLHEWQTDALRAAVTTNAHVEGDETAFAAATPTVRLGNRTQIFKNAVIVADTDDGLSKAGRAKEMAYQTLKIAKEQKRDIEASLFANNAANAGTSTTTDPSTGAVTSGNARVLAGVPAWIATNESNGGGSASAPTGDGTNNRTAGTARAFGQTDFDDVLQQIWTEGGNPDRVYLSPTNMNIALGFVGNQNQRQMVDAGEVNKVVDIYMTPWGSVEFTPSRHVRGSDVLILQSDMWEVPVLRGTKNTELAKTGDATKRQVITELTLCCKNEKANGGVFDTNG
jgi:hypothetical protein